MWAYTTDLSSDELVGVLKPVVIIKHSNRCSISAVALNRLIEKQLELDQAAHVILIDVVVNKSISVNIADKFGIVHESPQVIVIKNNEVVYTASHLGIKPSGVLAHL
jgi:bacillithiol system protein YtxJ